VEFAIVVPVLLLILLGSIEYGRVFWIQNSLTNAARVGARTMAIESSSANPSAVSDANAAVTSAAGMTPLAISVAPGSCATPAAGTVTYITVTATYSISQISGFLPPVAFPTSLIGKAQMRCDG
jgi:Flp pilus assembly protein TadG